MPTYRSIDIALHSQFDIETIPEYLPRPQDYYAERGITGNVPPFVDEKTSTCSVYVPVLPGSQFWIGYSISPPVPEDQQFLFKLFINGAHIVSWSTGKEEKWRGKTMFGLYERNDGDGKKRVEKRVLCFTPPDRKNGHWTDVTNVFDEDAFMEIRVHRAHGRKRIEREVKVFNETEHGKSRWGVDLVNAGGAGTEHPKRFYKFALIDPVDQPFASFRYYYRTWEQIYELGLLKEDGSASGDATELSVIEPYDAGDTDSQRTEKSEQRCEREQEDVFQGNHDGTSELQQTPLHANVPLGALPPPRRSDECSDDGKYSPQRHSGANSPRQQYRLSVPPSYRLSPPKRSSRPLPSIPHKSDPFADTSYQPHPAYPVEDWAIRTPSPVKSIRDGISTPPLGRRRGLNPTALMNIIATTWRRRGTPSSELSTENNERTAPCSVS